MSKLVVLDLFAGTGSATAEFASRGHKVVTVERSHRFKATIKSDIMFLETEDILDACGRVPDFVWASPPCTSFSNMSAHVHWRYEGDCVYCGEQIERIGQKWDHSRIKRCKSHRTYPKQGSLRWTPRTARAREGILNLRFTLDIIDELAPTYWLIENPRALMRKMPEVQGIPRHTITYCQYGDFRMKPTDLFGIAPSGFSSKSCTANAPCHEAATSRTEGTSGMKNKTTRAMVPRGLSVELADLIEQALL